MENIEKTMKDKGVVIWGAVRISVITARLIRCEIEPGGCFCDDPTAFAVNRAYNGCRYSVAETENGVTVSTDYMTVTYKSDGLATFTPYNLYGVLSGKPWKYGDVNENNLGGTLSTLDGVEGYVDVEKGTKALAWFSAGQYLSITVKIGNMTVTRPYSLASSPRDSLAGIYMLTIARVENGLVSQFIHDNWQVGTEVTASEPLGNFTYEPLRDAETVAAVVGGSSITPFRSMAKAIAEGDEDCNLVLIYGSRTLEDTMFLNDLKELADSCDKIKVVHVLSNEKIEGFEHGFITAELIRKYAPEGEYSLFVCGPQVMRKFVDKEIESLGLRKKFIRNELFGEYFGPAQEVDYPQNVAPAFKVTVRIAGQEKSITAPSDVSLLRSLEAAGIAAPAHCRSGECGWCHSKLVKGEVYTPKSVDGRREADYIYGYIHPCCTFPLSDVIIEVPPVRK